MANLFSFSCKGSAGSGFLSISTLGYIKNVVRLEADD